MSSATVDAFLAEHPLVEAVDLLLPDLSGILRGKRLGTGGLRGALRGECFLTSSLYAFDVTGATVERSSVVREDGEIDLAAALDPATLRPVPWQPGRAQILGGLADEHGGDPYFADPRALVARVAARFGELGLVPVAALELEFHLVDGRLGADGRPLVPHSPRLGARGTETEVFLPERLDDQERFLGLVEEYAAAQDVPLKGTVCEYAPSQFEVNLGHGRDMTRAADEAVMLKRLVRAAARATDQRATFMAKPFEGQSGSGLHVHVSLADREGRNLFGETSGGETALRHAAGGLLALTPESMALLAPNANSYRRLRPHAYAPTAATWGVNNRTVAVRVPPGPAAARRVEHRVAGADANPYLVLAAVLAGIHHGLSRGLDPGEPAVGDAYAARTGAGERLPLSWGEAISAFRRGEVLKTYLGERFRNLYADCREFERERFRAKITPTEYAWYLGI